VTPLCHLFLFFEDFMKKSYLVERRAIEFV